MKDDLLHIVLIGREVLHCIFGEVFAEHAGELGGEGFVGCDDECGISEGRCGCVECKSGIS